MSLNSFFEYFPWHIIDISYLVTHISRYCADIMATQDNLSHWIWQHVTKVDNSIIKCNRCGREYRNEKSTIHMKVHLFHAHQIHNKEDRISWENNDLLRQYFSKINLLTVKCEICDYILHNVHNASHLVTHLKSHPQIASAIWRYTTTRSSYQYQRRNVLKDHLNKGNNIKI